MKQVVGSILVIIGLLGGLPSWMPGADTLPTLSGPWQVLAIIGGTLISEDLTCIAVGTLIGAGKLPWLLGGVSCFLGIYIGDLLFFFLGRLGGQRLLRWKFFARNLGQDRLVRFGHWFDKRPWAAILACRFLPGIRVPLYLSVGALTTRVRAFFWWTCFFACIWTPVLIGLVALLGERFTKRFELLTGSIWIGILLTIGIVYLLVRTIILLSTKEGRGTLARRFGWIWGRKRRAAAAKERDVVQQSAGEEGRAGEAL